MGDEIKRAVVKDDALHLVRGSDVWSVKAEEGKEPNEWKMVHFANVGTSEEFIETFSGEILELVDGSLIFGEGREAVKNAIMTVVVEGLMPAFEHLKRIRASVTTLSLNSIGGNSMRILRGVYGMPTKTYSRKQPCS